jgi:hypothetical protein
MKARWLLAGFGLAAMLLGCPTREFYLQKSEVPWEARGVTRVAVPAFEAPPTAWAAADAARNQIVSSLSRGTVQVVESTQNPDAVLKGAIASYVQNSTPGAPRRVLMQSTQIQGDVYSWNEDIVHVVQVTVVLRVIGNDGSAIWSKDASGQANETNTITLGWPGDDAMAPPPSMPLPPNPALYERLRQNAMDQALAPLLAALATRYAYRPL